MEGTTSFASRRPAATSLPAFSLPPPPDVPSTRYPNHTSLASYASAYMNHQNSGGDGHGESGPSRPAPAIRSPPPPYPFSPIHAPSAGNPGNGVLTPNSGVVNDALSPSPGVHTGSSQNSQASIYYPSQMGSWPTPGGGTAYNFTSQSPANPATNSLVQPGGYSRTLFGQVSPSMPPFSGRSSASPANGENNLTAPPPYQDQPTFSTPLTSNGGNGALHHSLGQQAAAQSILASQAQTPTQAQAPGNTGGQQPSQDNGYRSTAAYYATSSAPQQTSYSPFGSAPQANPMPVVTSPATTAAVARGLNAMSPLGYPGPSGRNGNGSPYGGYGHAQQGQSPIGGPVLSNIHTGNGSLAMVGMPGAPGSMGMAPAYGHHNPMQPHFGIPTHHTHQPAPQDRPFKCDQCPQSFNRNHDLKRHKRIHLAVKPFPCTFCDKSFSRKDALKRHRLVKGCGEKANEASSSNQNVDEGSPADRDGMSDDPDSPIMRKE